MCSYPYEGSTNFSLNFYSEKNNVLYDSTFSPRQVKATIINTTINGVDVDKTNLPIGVDVDKTSDNTFTVLLTSNRLPSNTFPLVVNIPFIKDGYKDTIFKLYLKTSDNYLTADDIGGVLKLSNIDDSVSLFFTDIKKPSSVKVNLFDVQYSSDDYTIRTQKTDDTYLDFSDKQVKVISTDNQYRLLKIHALNLFGTLISVTDNIFSVETTEYNTYKGTGYIAIYKEGYNLFAYNYDVSTSQLT